MAFVNGGELVVRTLQKAGVSTLFGLHGAHIDTVFQSCRNHGISIVDTRHEAAAGHAAEGYARISRALGVALVTAGGGFTNVMTPIANAFLDRCPVLFITGSGALRDDQTNTLQAGIDQVAMATPVTKWAHRITATDQIPRLVGQAIRIATSAPRGPVLIDIPWDVLSNEVDDANIVYPELAEHPDGSSIRPEHLEATLEILSKAARPIIVVGSEASRAGAADQIEKLAKTTGIPVFADYEGLNLLSNLPAKLRGGLVQGLFGLHKIDAQPDAVLMAGIRFGLNTTHGTGALIPHSAKIIQIDPDAREIGRLQSVTKGIVCEVGGALEALASAAGNRNWINHSEWQNTVSEFLDHRYRFVAENAVAGDEFHPFHASAEIAKKANKDTIMVADGALTYLWLSDLIARSQLGGFLCHGYLGSMGVGFGVAVGAQKAALSLGRKVILVTGDGAVGYSLGEFDTLVRHGLPLIVVVMNNQSWGATLHYQRVAAGQDRITHTRLENGSYQAVAAALGADSYSAHDAASLASALESALAKNRPACINVQVALDPVPPEEMILFGQDPF